MLNSYTLAMHFPKISEITMTNVVFISRQSMLSEAIEMMFDSEHRHVFIIDENNYYVLSVYDVFRISRERRDISLSLKEIDMQTIPKISKEKNILETLEYLHNDFEQMIVLNEDGSVYGVVSQSDILSSIDPDTLMDTYRLSDLLKIKKRNRWINKEMVTQEVFDVMERNNHDASIIIENLKPLGIVTTKDILRLLKNRADLSLPIEHYMTTPVETVSHHCTLNEALQLMKDKHFNRIMTVDDAGRLIGSITQKELISIAYTRWVRMIQDYQEELQEINEKLEKKSRKFEKIASTDSLTGLYNRLKFLELFATEYTIMAQRHNSLSLLVIDLDHFKKVNDTYGHNVGDEVLKQISNLLLRELRSVDILCRWGGEEFVALLPAANIGDACHIAEKIRQSIETISIEGIPKITASIGVSQVQEGDNLHEVIERADKALYMAKIAGRNCVRKSL
jgi:diguanylate cyclase (GGDEF)-like protein